LPTRGFLDNLVLKEPFPVYLDGIPYTCPTLLNRTLVYVCFTAPHTPPLPAVRHTILPPTGLSLFFMHLPQLLPATPRIYYLRPHAAPHGSTHYAWRRCVNHLIPAHHTAFCYIHTLPRLVH